MVAFSKVKYEANDDTVYQLRVKPGRVASMGAETTKPIDSDIKAKISKGRKEYGIRPRGVTLGRTVGTGDETFVKYSFLPVLTKVAFAGTGFKTGTEITIDSVVWEVITRSDESIK